MKTGKIIGNGTLADNPKFGKGVQHCFQIGDNVNILKEHTDDNGAIIRVECERISDGLQQRVMPLHIEIN
jgi:hypothetical protein